MCVTVYRVRCSAYSSGVGKEPPNGPGYNRSRRVRGAALFTEGDEMEELVVTLAGLLETARQLPPSPDRYEALKQIGLMRQRLDAIHRADTKLTGASTTRRY